MKTPRVKRRLHDYRGRRDGSNEEETCSRCGLIRRYDGSGAYRWLIGGKWVDRFRSCPHRLVDWSKESPPKPFGERGHPTLTTELRATILDYRWVPSIRRYVRVEPHIQAGGFNSWRVILVSPLGGFTNQYPGVRWWDNERATELLMASEAFQIIDKPEADYQVIEIDDYGRRVES